MYYALVHSKSGKRYDFGNKSELVRWIIQHKSFLTPYVCLQWFLYRTEKTPYNFCNRLLCGYICTLMEYIVKHKLLNYGKKKKKPFDSIVPCGTFIGQL